MGMAAQTSRRCGCLVACLLLLVVLSSCASSYRYSHRGHSTFVEENIAQLHVGMLPEEVLALFGEPDEHYVSSFGADVGEPWSGSVWVYFIQRDARLSFARRYEKCVFVFHPPQGYMKLNHWELETHAGHRQTQ